MGWLRRWDIWGVVVGVVGIAVAAYAFYITDKVGRVSYTYDTQKVVDPANLSGFNLVDSNNQTIKEPVYATDFVIWNSGDLSLSEGSDRVREPIRVSVDGIIHYFIVSKFNIVPANNYQVSISLDKKSLSLHWHYFDPPQGIRMTIIHSNAAYPKISVSGRFFETSLAERPGPPPAKKADSPLTAGYMIIIIVLSLLGLCWFVVRVWKRKDVVLFDYFAVALLGVQTSLAVLLLIITYFPNGPPV